ncbi:YbaB/EbfC family nucleoid-associated protein [Nocardia cyriacigeorgica]|uniref:YbaB/EbfC family nucleoid-associated protein n=1 Tax=Nocardia cyriacigeorgica TaxID=135487 RepID=A0A5R8P0S9_9NOCA|nr:YbaB/EbfC family nucleoid-associated protein [Nocardia cyriacigeorgica]TLF82551.1 YbaB/EbfC family nucleoid-associated protein [Nocardia cyriacigeorgica]
MNDDREAMRSRNDALRAQVGDMLETFERQRQDLAAAQQRIATAQVTAWSSDNLVRVTSNAAGIPLDVHIEPEAFKRSTPERLSRSITEAVQAAAREGVQVSQQAFASVEAAADEMPDLPDLVPGAPSIRDLVDKLIPEPPVVQDAPPPPSAQAPLDDEDEDEYYRNRSYLDGGR